MKKLCANFLVFQLMTGQIFANPSIFNKIESGESLHTIFEAPREEERMPVGPVARKPMNRQAGGNASGAGKNKKADKRFESNTTDIDISSQPKPLDRQQNRRNNVERNSSETPVLTFGEQENSKGDKESSQKLSDGRSESTTSDKGLNKGAAVTGSLSADDQRKIAKIKKDLQKLQEDPLVGNVFTELGMHGNFDELLKSFSDRADKAVAQSDLNKVQKFLNDLVAKKDQISALQPTTRDQFLNKFKKVIQSNFTDFSLEEMGKFFKATSELTTNAKKSAEVAGTSKQSGKDKYVDPSGKPAKKSHGFGKGMMHHGSGDGSLLGALGGMIFMTVIFAIVQELSNEGV